MKKILRNLIIRYGAINAFTGGSPANKIIPTNSYTQITVRKLKHRKVLNCINQNVSVVSCNLEKVAEEFIFGESSLSGCSNFEVCKIPQVKCISISKS